MKRCRRINEWAERLVFLMIPGGHFLFLPSAGEAVMRGRGIWGISAMALMAASEGIMAWMVVRWCRREQLKEQIQEFKYMEQMNQTRDLVARQRRQEAKELREKLWKELQKAKEIIRESAGGEENGGLSEGASSAFQGLLQDARAQAEQEVCENALVNTVLEEKKRFCQTFGIHLSVQVEVPADLEVKHYYLCSVFANLLDNAIDACREQKLLPEERLVKVEAQSKGDYLFIRVSNPATREYAERPDKAGHGLGRETVARIAGECGGEYWTWVNDKRYTAAVVLQIRSGSRDERKSS